MATDQTTENAPAPAAPSVTPDAQPAPAQAPAVSAQPATQPSQTATIPSSPAEDDELRRVKAHYQNLNQQFAQVQQRLAQQEQQAEQLRLANASDEEKASYYAQQVQQFRAQQAANERANAEYQFYNNAAADMLREAGIAFNDPRIQPFLSAGATAQGIAELAKGIAKISAAEVAAAREEAAKASKRGAIEALNEAGVTATSNGTGAGSAASTQTAAQRAYEARREQLAAKRNRGQTVTPADYAELRKLAQAAELA